MKVQNERRLGWQGSEVGRSAQEGYTVMLINSFCLSMNYLTIEGKSLSAIHEGPRCPQIRETTKRSKCVWALPSSAWEMVGTLIKEAWQLGVQPGFTAHSRASYTGPGALRDANYYPVRSWTG